MSVYFCEFYVFVDTCWCLCVHWFVFCFDRCWYACFFFLRCLLCVTFVCVGLSVSAWCMSFICDGVDFFFFLACVLFCVCVLASVPSVWACASVPSVWICATVPFVYPFSTLSFFSSPTSNNAFITSDMRLCLLVRRRSAACPRLATHACKARLRRILPSNTVMLPWCSRFACRTITHAVLG